MKLVLLVVLALVHRLTVAHNPARPCPFPGIPGHATAKTGHVDLTWRNRQEFQEGDTIDFTCKEHWVASYRQVKQIKCQKDGTWDGSPPRCDRKSNRSNWKLWIADPDGYWQRDEMITGNCSNKGQLSRNIRLTAHENGGLVSQIIVESCGDPVGYPAVTSVTLGAEIPCAMETRVDAGRTVFSCQNASHSQSQSHVITITLERQGSLSSVNILLNEGKNCNLPPVPINGDVSSDFVGDRLSVTYQCNQHLQLEGPGSSTCNSSTGRWTPLPKCVCPDPPAVPYSKLEKTSNYTAVYRCQGHSRIIGLDTVHCDVNSGQWSEPPTCECSTCEAGRLKPIVIVIVTSVAVLLMATPVLLFRNCHGCRLGKPNPRPPSAAIPSVVCTSDQLPSPSVNAEEPIYLEFDLVIKHLAASSEMNSQTAEVYRQANQDPAYLFMSPTHVPIGNWPATQYPDVDIQQARQTPQNVTLCENPQYLDYVPCVLQNPVYVNV